MMLEVKRKPKLCSERLYMAFEDRSVGAKNRCSTGHIGNVTTRLNLIRPIHPHFLN